MTCTCKEPLFDDLMDRIKNAAHKLSEDTAWFDRAQKSVSHSKFEYEQALRAMRDHHDRVAARSCRAEAAIKDVQGICSEAMTLPRPEGEGLSADALSLAGRVLALLPKDGAR